MWKDTNKIWRENTERNEGHENSTCSTILMSVHWCRTSGILDYQLCVAGRVEFLIISYAILIFFTIPYIEQDSWRFWEYLCPGTHKQHEKLFLHGLMHNKLAFCPRYMFYYLGLHFYRFTIQKSIIYNFTLSTQFWQRYHVFLLLFDNTKLRKLVFNTLLPNSIVAECFVAKFRVIKVVWNILKGFCMNDYCHTLCPHWLC